MDIPSNYSNQNKALLGAFRKGVLAHRSGQSSIADCPYRDKRVNSGRLSWSRAFINAWRDGFRWSEKVACDDLH